MASKVHQSSTFTSDFRAEFEASTDKLLRRQFVWFASITGAAGLILCGYDLASYFTGATISHFFNLGRADDAEKSFPWQAVLYSIVFVAVHAAAAYAAATRRFASHAIERLTIGVVIFDAVGQILVRRLGVEPAIGMSFWGTMWVHSVAAIFLPWSTWQAARAGLIVYACYIAITCTYTDPISSKLFRIAFFPLLVAPGTVIAWIKHTSRYEQHKLTFFQRRYADVRRELVDARRIHEALFPPPRITRSLRFSYEYEPMRQIGGDYLYANWFGPSGRDETNLSVVLMDVTGHGIPAALTVNRLHGELERVFAENPEIGPGQVLDLLNRYVHLTLATHSVFVTALCLKVNLKTNVLDYASGGHPPAFLRTIDGRIHELNSTAFVLGACGSDEFHADPQSLHFGPGDALIAYTDGAIEARDRTGKMMGVKGVQKLVAFGNPDPAGGWTRTIRHAVESHRYGPPADDTLVVEISRNL
ncbi:MAG TPA: PP2C family protein-serine/threonine phosphatase [Phycisphaerales bacterium]|nr:PP2C family protein-serine/threonine phosphatase [Phycisphaerales bacterium]